MRAFGQLRNDLGRDAIRARRQLRIFTAALLMIAIGGICMAVAQNKQTALMQQKLDLYDGALRQFGYHCGITGPAEMTCQGGATQQELWNYSHELGNTDHQI